MKDVLISCTRVRKCHIKPQAHLTVSLLGIWCVHLHGYLHGECVRERGHTLQGLVGTAAATSPHRHTGRDKEVVGLPRQLPPNLHQTVPRLTPAPRIHLEPPPHWWSNTEKECVLNELFQVHAWRWVLCRKREHTFSTLSGFGRVCRPPVSKLQGEIQIFRKLMRQSSLTKFVNIKLTCYLFSVMMSGLISVEQNTCVRNESNSRLTSY